MLCISVGPHRLLCTLSLNALASGASCSFWMGLCMDFTCLHESQMSDVWSSMSSTPSTVPLPMSMQMVFGAMWMSHQCSECRLTHSGATVAAYAHLTLYIL